METLSVLLQELRSLDGRMSRLQGNVLALEARLQSAMSSERRITAERLKALRKDVGQLQKHVKTPLWKQLWGEWYIRLMILIGLGLANIDLKEAIAIVLQIK